MYNTTAVQDAISRHAATEKNAGRIRIRRTARTFLADNSTAPAGWITVEGGDSIPALVQIEETAAEGGVGEQDPVVRGGVVFYGCTPQVGDGVVVLSGEHAGKKFRITAVVSLVGTSFECGVVATTESFT